MAYVSDEEKEQMARFLAVMNGTPLPAATHTPRANHSQVNESVELAGPGVPTKRDIDAMANVLNKLNALTNDVAKDMVVESATSKVSRDAISTTRNNIGVKVGSYQIKINEDDTRLAGKKYYSIYHSEMGTIIADDVSLYETALGVVNLLNNGKYVNDIKVRQLFDADNVYTSHYMDAVMYKRKFRESQRKNSNKADLYESRYQASLNLCMKAKRDIKSIV